MFAKYFYFILVLTAFSSLFAQSDKIKMNDYKKEKDSLLVQKQNLLSEKDLLENDIEQLHLNIESLKSKLYDEQRELYILKYGEKDGVNVLEGKIWKGMSENMLRDSWGEPDKINKNKEKWGVFTQWYYGNIIYFFRDSIMTDWEERK